MHKKSLQPISGKWQDEIVKIKDLGLSDSMVALFCDYIAYMHTLDVLVDLIDKRKIKFSQTDSLENICIFVLSHIYHLSDSIYQLCKLGYGNSSIILGRSIISFPICRTIEMIQMPLHLAPDPSN